MKKIALLLVIFFCVSFSQSIESLTQLNASDLMALKREYSSSMTSIASPITPTEGSNNENYKNSISTLNSSTIDQIINPEDFYLGPGDLIIINIWDTDEHSFEVTINEEGEIIIPSIGVIPVKGLNLSTIKKSLIEKVKDSYHNVKISISVKELRGFNVTVNGMIKNKGSYKVDGVTRISSILVEAGNILNTGNKREILITNEAFPTRTVDITNFYNSGNLKENPFLRKGDNIFVRPRSKTIEIWGSVDYEGIYDYKENETLNDIINLSGGLKFNADTSRICITRFEDNLDSLIDIKVSFNDRGSFEILPDDRIIINSIPDFRIHRQIIIKGEVKFPGTYPIRDDKTNLIEIIKKAGGFTEDAFLPGSKIVRKNFLPVGEKEYLRVQNIPLPNLTPSERSYLKYSTTEEHGQISIDLGKLVDDEINDIILRDKDEITIAKNNLSVKVMGAVINPGLIGYQNGKNYKHYIHLAGGFKKSARKTQVMIIKGGTENWIEPNKVENIEAGDAIWVPEREYINGIKVFKDALLILGAIATIIISTITIHDALTTD